MTFKFIKAQLQFPKVLLAIIILIPLFGIQFADAKHDGTPNSPAVIILTASWCGTCRELIPIVEKAVQSSAQNNLKVVTLDVDASTSPDEAKQYGLSIAGAGLPQVYLFNRGQTSLLFNGKDYHFGHSAQVQAQIQDRLNSSH